MAMYNRYRGSGGSPEKLKEPSREPPKPVEKPATSPKLPVKTPAPRSALLKSVSAKLGELETEDILLVLILYLMYRESGDTELLLIIGAMYLI